MTEVFPLIKEVFTGIAGALVVSIIEIATMDCLHVDAGPKVRNAFVI
jgi:hypothetical protein